MLYEIIRREGTFPPGGFIFTDPRTGHQFDGIGFKRTVDAIVEHRRANPRLYPTSDGKYLDWEFTAQELSIFSCQRIGNQSQFCKLVNGANVFKPEPMSEVMKMDRVCAKCGEVNGKVKLCETCGGRKVIGFFCVQCSLYQSR